MVFDKRSCKSQSPSRVKQRRNDMYQKKFGHISPAIAGVFIYTIEALVLFTYVAEMGQMMDSLFGSKPLP